MQRLGELNNKVIVEQKTVPENKHVIWKDPVEGKFKEFKDGGWVESEEIAIPGSGGSEIKLYDTIDELVSDIFNAKYIDVIFSYVSTSRKECGLEYTSDDLCNIGDTVVGFFNLNDNLKYFTAECARINYSETSETYIYTFNLIDFIDWNVQQVYVYINQ